MRKYELVVIVHPDLDEANFQAVVEKVSGWVSESGGNVDKIDVWGRRRLAYLINKQREGYKLLEPQHSLSGIHHALNAVCCLNPLVEMS